MPNRYDILLMDADGTLFDFIKAEATALEGAFGDLELPFSPEVLSLYHDINDRLWKCLEKGEVTRDELVRLRFRRLFDALKLPDAPDAAIMNKSYIENLSRCGFLLEGAYDVCEKLSSLCRLFIITNGLLKVQTGRFADCPISRFFEKIFISEQLGFNKPKKQYFDAVADAIPGYDPARVLVVGDSLSSDIQGGINAGLDVCWFNPGGIKNGTSLKPDYEIKALDELLDIV